MKPTPEMIDAALSKTPFIPNDGNRAWMAEALSAALSVQPSAAVVGEPVAWIPQSRWERMTAAEPWLTNIVYSEDQSKFFSCVPLYAAPSAPEGWQPIETAPHACHVIACYFYECEWIYDVVLSPPSTPFTHWKMLPSPPALGGKP